MFGSSIGVAKMLPAPVQKIMAGMAPPQPNYIFVPTGEARKIIQAPDPPENKIVNTKVCVIDTGIGFPDVFMLPPSKGRMWMTSTIEQPNFLDGLGHGHWCITAAFGASHQARYGLCMGVADPVGGKLGSVKCLSTLGFGTTWSVIQAMEKAVKWGAKVISLSLGGELQGSVDFDPQCSIIERLKDQVIFVVAAGNSGPDEWTINSPGASPSALTVGSYSPVYGGVSIFSSRGASAPWYKANPEQYIRDFAAHGYDMVKPDVIAPGGGPVEDGQKVDLIYSAVRGWTDGMNDSIPGDGFDGMRGTSMATPLVAGLVALAVEKNLVRTASDVKRKMSLHGLKPKLLDRGYGLIRWSDLTAS